jgi:hypothetical protein
MAEVGAKNALAWLSPIGDNCAGYRGSARCAARGLKSYAEASAERQRETVMGYVFLVIALTLNAAANVLMKVGADLAGLPLLAQRAAT